MATHVVAVVESLSARRAWIEIAAVFHPAFAVPVALRKESVDRNMQQLNAMQMQQVALRKESVDRNSADARQNERRNCRSPQGERG